MIVSFTLLGYCIAAGAVYLIVFNLIWNKLEQFVPTMQGFPKNLIEEKTPAWFVSNFIIEFIFFVLLQIVGINLTTLAVFGGALGVGLGFGLQQIASNFISGIIILLDGSLTVGDYIELEDGRTGHLIALNMRSSTIETFEGKEIVVPNEQFITTAFTNWTRKDPFQRYTVEFSVSYDSDIPAIPALILEAVRKHPQILETPEPPDCEITGFGDSGVNFHVEYWMEGIDDGKNRVDSDLMIIIWNTLKENNISIPFPQREVRIIGGESPP